MRFFFFLHALICFLSPPCNFWMISKHFPMKNLHFLQPFKSKTLGIGNFNSQFLKITLPEKPLTVLYTDGRISKGRSMKLISVSNKSWSVLLTKNSFYPKSLAPFFVGVQHIWNFHFLSAPKTDVCFKRICIKLCYILEIPSFYLLLGPKGIPNWPVLHSARHKHPARERHKIRIASQENVDNQTPRNTNFTH